MAIISMLPSGIKNNNRTFRSKIIRLKANQWIKFDNEYKYTAIVDGISINDKISFKLSPEYTTPSEDVSYAFSLITGIKYGVNYIELFAKDIPTVNFDIEIFNMVYDAETLYKIIDHLSSVIDNATTLELPNTLVLRDANGIISASVDKSRKSELSDKSTSDELGRNIIKTYAELDSPSFRKEPTTPYPNSMSKNYNRLITNVEFVMDKIKSEISSFGSLVFKGTVGENGTVTVLPTDGVSRGHLYVVITNGNYGGYDCSLGDLLIAKYNSPVQSDSKDDWSWVPSGQNTVTSVRFTDDDNKTNITDKALTGDLVVGNIINKIVDEVIDNEDSTNIPTTKAVCDKLNEHISSLNNIAAINTKKGPIPLQITDGYPGSISIESIEAVDTKIEYNKLILLSSIIADGTVITLNDKLKSLNGVSDKIIRSTDNRFIDYNIECGDWYEEINVGCIVLNDLNDWSYDETTNTFSCIFTDDNDLQLISNSLANYDLQYHSNILTSTDTGFFISNRSGNNYKIYIRFADISSIDRLKEEINTNPINIIYPLLNKIVKKLEDTLQVKFAKLSTNNQSTTIATNADSIVEVYYPENLQGSVTMRGYNSHQRIMYTLIDNSLYMTTK